MSSENKIHIISLVDEDQTKIYEQVEEVCKVQLIELPSNVAEVLCDGGDDTQNPIRDIYG